MNTVFRTSLGVSALALSSISGNAQANDELHVGLGVGVGVSQSIYKGIDTETDALPMLNVEYGNFYLEGLEAGYDFLESDNYRVSIAVAGDSLNGERTDSNQLADMGDVDSGVNLKVSGEMFTDFGLLGASIAQDVSDEHEGTEVSLSLGLPLDFDRLELMPAVHATWMSDDLVNHYYGVTSKQARPGRSVYNADAGWRYGVELMAFYPLTQQWSVTGGVSAEWFGDEVKNSPIVDDDSAVSGFLGVQYHF